MRLVTLAVALLLVLIQYPLWFGDGGWFKVWDKEHKIAASQRHNDELRMRNAALEAEVRDLRDGTSAMEERARFELGMVRGDELFVQIIEPGQTVDAVPQTAAAVPVVAGPAGTTAPVATPRAASASDSARTTPAPGP